MRRLTVSAILTVSTDDSPVDSEWLLASYVSILFQIRLASRFNKRTPHGPAPISKVNYLPYSSANKAFLIKHIYLLTRISLSQAMLSN